MIAHPVENREGPYVALTAHLDTVLAPRNVTKRSRLVLTTIACTAPASLDNGRRPDRLAGHRAPALVQIRASKKSSAAVVFIANVGEEGEGNLSGMRYLCRQSATGSRIRSFLILDGPNTDHITLASAGQPPVRRYLPLLRPRRT